MKPSSPAPGEKPFSPAPEIKLYKELHELTLPECAQCPLPFTCCSNDYCEAAIEYTKERFDIDITDKIVEEKDRVRGCLFLNRKGCVIEPHQRPLCTAHSCHIANYGHKPNDKEWTRKYYELRNKISELYDNNLTKEQHIEWLKNILKEGLINKQQFMIARSLVELPNAFTQHHAIRLIYGHLHIVIGEKDVKLEWI